MDSELQTPLPPLAPDSRGRCRTQPESSTVSVLAAGSGLISRTVRSQRGDSLLSSPLPPAVLKEADSVSQPAQQVQTLWKRRSGEDSDPEPVYTPRPGAAPLPPTLPPLPPHRVRANVRFCCCCSSCFVCTTTWEELA